MPLMQYVTQFRWDYVKVPGFWALTLALYLRLPGDYLPWGLGGQTDGSLWTAPPATVSHTSFPLIVPDGPLRRSVGHSLSPDVLGWPALLDCRIRLTASLQPPHIDAAGTGCHWPASAIEPDDSLLIRCSINNVLFSLAPNTLAENSCLLFG